MNNDEIIEIYNGLDDKAIMVLYLINGDRVTLLRKEYKLLCHDEEVIIAFDDDEKYYIGTYSVVAIKIFNMKEMIE